LPLFPASSRMVLFQVSFTLTLLASCGFQSNACFSVDSSLFLSVRLIHHYYFILIFETIGFSPVAFHSMVFLIILGHPMPIILHQHWLTNICNLVVIWLVTFHVSHPYSSKDLTLLLNIQILVFIEIFLFLHNGYNYTKSHLPSWSMLLTSWSATLSTITTLPRYVNCSTLSITILFTFIFVVTFKFIHSSFVFLELISSPAVAAPAHRLHSTYFTWCERIYAKLLPVPKEVKAHPGL
jgi:hypothetical protein